MVALFLGDSAISKLITEYAVISNVDEQVDADDGLDEAERAREDPEEKCRAGVKPFTKARGHTRITF